ncbi:ComEC/Rec2 family competence protein [Carboxylicivirga sp. N1Y90]|uniref:ComEC/Rec2 family competence protein n=1 Tax=Carboxylicivirga fragile TaxID=3417571 RepID=UPI003D3271B7|nr:ComEC/Rec2 family competence protein [Marinilabiliaceae bacterium N1Y90]
MLHVFLKKAPFLRIVIPFIIGIYSFGGDVDSHFAIALLLFVIIFYVLFVIWYKKHPLYHWRWLHGFIVFVILLLSGFVYHQQRPAEFIESNSSVSAKVLIIRELGETEKSTRYLVKLHAINNDSLHNFHGSKGLVYLSKSKFSERVLSGQTLLIKGSFISFQRPLIPYGFDYLSYLKNQRWHFGVYVSQLKQVQSKKGHYNLFVLSAKLRTYLNEKYKLYGIGVEELSVLNALFLGDKSDLQYELKQKYSSAGALHLLAVSGLHVGIIYLILSSFLKLFLGKYRRLLAISLIICLWVYAFVTGLSPSVLRASIMFSILEMGRLWGRQVGVYNLLGASMFLILLIDPLTIYNVGFWLSHCAVASIVAFYSSINKWIYFSFPPFRWAWSIIALSLSAQIGAGAISIMVFHQFPIYFLLSNPLLIPAVTLALVLAVVGALFCWSGLIMSLLTEGMSDVLFYMNNVVTWIDGLPFALQTRLNFEPIQLGLFFLIFIMIYFYLESSRIKLVFATLFITILFVLSFHCNRALLPQRGILMSKSRSVLLVNYFNDSVNEVYASKAIANDEIKFLFDAYWTKYGVKHEHQTYLACNDSDSLLTVKFVGDKSYFIVRKKLVWPSKGLTKPVECAAIMYANQFENDSVYENIALRIIDSKESDKIFYHAE